jgi:hypothetical protein
MGQFDYDGKREIMEASVTPEKCKPDFEGMIGKEREKKDLLQKFYDATKEVVLSPIHIDLQMSKLKDLMGSIHVRLLVADKTINTLILEKGKQEEESYKD